MSLKLLKLQSSSFALFSKQNRTQMYTDHADSHRFFQGTDNCVHENESLNYFVISDNPLYLRSILFSASRTRVFRYVCLYFSTKRLKKRNTRVILAIKGIVGGSTPPEVQEVELSEYDDFFAAAYACVF